MRLQPFASIAALALFAASALVVPFLPAADEGDGPPGLIAALKGHKEAVYSVAFSPDGKFVVTGSGDPSVKIWQAGKEFKTYSGPNAHKQLVLAVAVSPDGTQFATAAADNTARIWDFPSSKHLRQFAQGSDGRAVAVSADGKTLAGGGKDGKVKLWNAADGKLLLEIPAHTSAVSGLSFSPNGQMLVSSGDDGTLRFVNVADGKTLAHYAAHAGAVAGVAYSPNNNAVYSAGTDGTLTFWSLPPVASRVLAAAVKDPISALALSPDAGVILAANDRGVRLANLNNGQTVKDLTGAPAALTSVAASPGNAYIAAGTTDRRLVVWETKTGEVRSQSVAHGGAVAGVVFNSAGTQAATVGKDGVLRLWAMPPVPTRTLTQPDAVRAAVLSADGKRLAAGGADKIIRVYKLDNLQAPERQLSGCPSASNAVAISPDGKMIVSGGEDDVVRFWSLSRGEQTAHLGAHAGPVASLVFSGNGSQVLSASGDGSVKLFAVPAPNGKGVFSHAGAVTAATLSPDGSRLLTGCADKTLRLWNLTNGQVERTWTGPTLALHAVAYSPQGNRVAAGSADKSLFVWEAASNKEVRKFVNLPAAVESVALSPDGKQVVGGLADGSVRLYDLASGKEVASFTDHKGEVTGLLFTSKGDGLISAGGDGGVYARVLTPKIGPAVKWAHGAAVRALALSRDGTRIAVGGADKKIKVRVLANGKEEETITTPAEVRGLSFNADGKRLAVAGADGKARIYGLDGELDEYLAHDGAVNAVVYAADGKRIFTASADKTARVWTPSLVWRARHDGAARQAVFSPRGDRVLSVGADGLVRLWGVNDGKPMQAIRAHTGGVVALGVSADGGRLATVGADKTLRVWELAKLPAGKTGGKEVDAAAATTALPAVPKSVSLSPNGQRIAVGFSAPMKGKETVRIYDGATGKELLDQGDPDGLPSRVVSFLSDNRTLLAAGADRTVRLVDVNVQAAFDVHAGGAAAVAYHNNGTQILTAGADKTVKLWTLATGKLDRTFGPTAEAVSSAVFSRDFTQIAATAGKTLAVWSISDGKQVLSIEQPAAATAVSFNSDRTRIATANADGRARVWDIATKKELQGFLHTGAVTGVVFLPSTPNQLVSAGIDKTVGVSTMTATRIIALGGKINGLMGPTNTNHVLTAGADGKVPVYNVGNGVAERTLEAGDKPALCVSVSRNGQLIAVGSADKKVRLFAFNATKVLSEFTAPAEPRSLAFSGNNQALTAASADGSLTTWDVVYAPGQPVPAEFGKVLQVHLHGAKTSAADVVYPSVGAVFYSTGSDGTVRSWKVPSESPIRTFNHNASVNALAYNATGTQLATGCSDGRVRIFDLEKAAPTRDILAHGVANNPQAVYCVAFSPDGKQVVSGSIDNSLKLWNAATGAMVREFKAYKEKVFEKGHQDAVLSVAFSPDGKHIVSGSMDRTIKIWNVADGSVVRDMVNPALKPAGPGQPAPAHPGWVYAVRYCDGGKKIVSAGGAPRLRGYLATWEADTGKRLFGKEMGVGTLYSVAVSPDGQQLVLGTGGSVRSGEELNQGLVLKMPK